MSTRKKDDLVQPYEMELKARYLNRFTHHTDMTDLFSESSMCQEVAEQIWRDRMVDATVTVRMLNGDEFFIS